MDSVKPAPVLRLPFLYDLADAERVAKELNDPFYVIAFIIQLWLSQLLAQAAAQYAENKNPRDRSLQSGEAWRALTSLFNLAPQEPPLVTRPSPLVTASSAPRHSPLATQQLLGCLYRFSVEDNSPRNSLRHTLARLSVEHLCTGDYFGPKTMKAFSGLATPPSSLATEEDPSSPVIGPGLVTRHSSLATVCHRTLIRWCDWLDSEIHLRIHRHWHEAPASFDPDPETRHLAALGNAQRNLGKLDLYAQAGWARDLALAIQQFKDSPKWAALGKAMADSSDRQWLYPDVDTLVIGLWPLVKTYNWTYRDLLNVIRPALKRPDAYPCSVEHEFAPYCVNVLGLKKTGRGRSAKNGRPKGYDVALELCPALKR